MRIEFNKTGAERKALVTAVGEILGTKPKYMGMPTAAYNFDGLIIDKEGTLEFDEMTSDEDIENLLNQLAERGFISEGVNTPKEQEKAAENENVGLTVQMPIEMVRVENLMNLLKAKESLIKKALGIDDLRIDVDEEKVTFPWFGEVDSDDAMSYTKFIAALCKMSKEQKRINPMEKEVINEKYAFRCFLLRLGFIGDDFKADRKILLRNLSGSSAFKNRGEQS